MVNNAMYSTLQNWPERTDPQKFVYEDIAIATYLLVGRYFNNSLYSAEFKFSWVGSMGRGEEEDGSEGEAIVCGFGVWERTIGLSSLL